MDKAFFFLLNMDARKLEDTNTPPLTEAESLVHQEHGV